MKRTVSLIFLITGLCSSCFAQKESRTLKIYSITEYIDGYLIKAIDSLKRDTLNIISVKDTNINEQKFERMIVGRKYNFEYEDYVNTSAAMSPENFIIRIRTTVVWRGSDENRDRPVFAKNIKGLWITK